MLVKKSTDTISRFFFQSTNMWGSGMKSLFSPFTLLCLGSILMTAVWYVFNNNTMPPPLPVPQKKRAPKTFNLCKECKEEIGKVMHNYSQIWRKQEDNYLKFRSQLRAKCNGFNKAIITQENSPVGSKLVYDWQKTTIKVDRKLFGTLIKEHPFSNRTWDTCAVVGNGGVLADSGCGPMIDSAQFVFRYASLMERRGPFVESLHTYSNSLLLLPAFSFGSNTPVCLRVAYTVEDFGSPIRPVYNNPEYIINLHAFWHTHGLQLKRLSTGLMLVSLALEVCENVHVYGFWPYFNHPFEYYDLTNHYYDDAKAKKGVHAMPAEFELLMKLHNQGVLKLHLGDC